MLQDIALVAVGVVVGSMNAIAGGGMLIGFPVLVATGLPPLVANATSNITVLPGGLAAAFAYRKRLRTVPRRFLLLIIPCVLGAAIGAILLRKTSFENFEQIVPWLVLFAVVLFAFQPLLHFHLHRHMMSNSRIANLKPMLIFSLAILPVAIYGGYFGAGFGFIMLAFLGFTSLHDVHKMNAVKNLAASCISIATFICLLGSGLISWREGLLMGLGGFIGGYTGATLAQKVSSHVIRIVVIVVGLSTAIYLGVHRY